MLISPDCQLFSCCEFFNPYKREVPLFKNLKFGANPCFPKAGKAILQANALPEVNNYLS
jgi:hypothetical protein